MARRQGPSLPVCPAWAAVWEVGQRKAASEQEEAENRERRELQGPGNTATHWQTTYLWNFMGWGAPDHSSLKSHPWARTAAPSHFIALLLPK